MFNTNQNPCYSCCVFVTDCTALIVLAEEELVGIDLTSENWNMLSLPYLVSLHASAVTCSTYISDVPQSLWDDIIAVGATQTQGVYSDAVSIKVNNYLILLILRWLFRK